MSSQPSRPLALSLLFGYLLALVLLGKLTHDLAALDARFFVPAWGVFLLAFGIAGLNVIALVRGRPASDPSGRSRALLVLAIPTAFVASVLDCMGLSFEGCTSVCNALVQIGTPGVAVVSLLYLATGRRAVLALLTLLPFAFLVPNCLCRNPINRDWIDWLGLSPACFGSAFGTSVIALAALHSGKRVRSSIFACWTIVAGMLAFFVGHHYYDFPW